MKPAREEPLELTEPRSAEALVFENQLYEMSMDGEMRPVVAKAGYEVALVGKTLYNKMKLLEATLLIPGVTESHLFRCAGRCRRTTRYWFTENEVAAKERCRCHNDRRLFPTIYLPRNEIDTILERY